MSIENLDLFSQLTKKGGRKKPRKKVLRKLFLEQVKRLPTLPEHRKILVDAFNISFEGHRTTPRRESGEAYFYHVLRSAIRMIWRQIALKIYDPIAIAIVLLHDCFEETERGIDSILIRTQVSFLLGETIADGVMTLTKHKESGETSNEYCTRLSECTSWRVLWAKFEDRYDNIWSIRAMPEENQYAKINETLEWFPIFAAKLRELIEVDRDKKNNSEWQQLPDMLLSGLQYAIAAQGKQ